LKDKSAFRAAAIYSTLENFRIAPIATPNRPSGPVRQSAIPLMWKVAIPFRYHFFILFNFKWEGVE